MLTNTQTGQPVAPIATSTNSSGSPHRRIRLGIGALLGLIITLSGCAVPVPDEVAEDPMVRPELKRAEEISHDLVDGELLSLADGSWFTTTRYRLAAQDVCVVMTDAVDQAIEAGWQVYEGRVGAGGPGVRLPDTDLEREWHTEVRRFDSSHTRLTIQLNVPEEDAVEMVIVIKRAPQANTTESGSEAGVVGAEPDVQTEAGAARFEPRDALTALDAACP